MQPSALCSIFLADVGEVQESGEQLCFLDVLREVGPEPRLNTCAANNYVQMCLIWQFLRQVRSSFSLPRGMSENSPGVFGTFAWFNHFLDNGLCHGASDIVFVACHSSLSCCLLKISPTQSKKECADRV